jgi:pimeloyl-ACP methyl ester carboxylesterase
MTSQQTCRRSRRSALRSLGRVRVLDGGDLPQRPPVELLVEHFTVYVHDRRGRGDSTDTQPYAIQREVEGLAALIAHAGGSAFVYGMSSGCRWPCTQQPKGW